jgi:glycosyltransferase involved in cell wall biosynthesis
MPFVVTYLIDRFAPSETFIRREIEQLRRRNWTVFTRLLNDNGDQQLKFALFSCPDGFRMRFCRAAAGRILEELPRNPLVALRILKRLPQTGTLIKKTLECESRLIHSHFSGITADMAAIAARTLGINWSCSVHASDIYTVSSAVTRRRLAGAVAIAACSRKVMQATIDTGIPAERVHLIRHGLPMNDFPLNTIRPEEFIFTACRLNHKKGLDTLLKACAALAERGIDTPCVIAGAGADEFKLKKLRGALNLNDRVFFKGWLSPEETRTYLRNSICTVLPSRRAANGDRDGIANILVESLALGSPVITTNAGSADEFIQNGINGLLIEPDNHLTLADAIDKVLKSEPLRRQFIEEGRRTAEICFDGASNIQKMEALFDYAVNQTGRVSECPAVESEA